MVQITSKFFAGSSFSILITGVIFYIITFASFKDNATALTFLLPMAMAIIVSGTGCVIGWAISKYSLEQSDINLGRIFDDLNEIKNIIDGGTRRTNSGKYKIFLSYATADLSENYPSFSDSILIKKRLEFAEFEIFHAKKNIVPSRKWREELLLEIKSCDCFVALATENYRNGFYTDHEFGAAVGLGKQIVSVVYPKCEMYGFMEQYQVIQLDPHEYEGVIAWKVAVKLVDAISKIYNEEFMTLDYHIRSFVESCHYAESNYHAIRISKFKDFTPKQCNDMANGMLTNDQIYGTHSFEVSKVADLLTKHSDKLDIHLMNKLTTNDKTKHMFK